MTKIVEDNIFVILSESNKVIFKAILYEAESAARSFIRKGCDISKAVKMTVEQLSLTTVETLALFERLRKPDPVKKEPVLETPIDEEHDDRQKVLYFENTDELDEAVQILMDKSIDWTEKATTATRPYVQFADDTKLSEAQSALRRKWDFVESRKRLVAAVQFDNLRDYTKVLEFMRRQGMLLEFNEGLTLDEDYDQLQTNAATEQKSAEKENRPYSIGEQVTSFVAKSRSPRQKSRVDPVKESRFRAVYTRRKFQF
jgi:hypothetical protein